MEYLLVIAVSYPDTLFPNCIVFLPYHQTIDLKGQIMVTFC